MYFFYAFLISAAIIFAYMSLWFAISTLAKNTSFVDTAWGLGFLVLASYWLFKTHLFLPRQIIVTTLVALWAFRLSYRLLKRSLKKGEDPRYLKLKEKWQNHTQVKIFLYVFMLQGLLILIISSPIIAVNTSSVSELTILDYFALGLWLCGFFFEVVGDWELDKFLAEPKNKDRIMKYGLWKYSRHPNYFGESLIWWALFLFALNVPYGVYTIISPLTITYLLVFVSGIPMAEKLFENNKEYQEYKKKTSPFIPLIPKN